MLARMETRWSLIRKLNRLLTVALPLIDLTRVDVSGTTASNLSKCRHLMLQVLKTPLWTEALSRTQTAGDTTLEVPRDRAVNEHALGIAKRSKSL